jgi:hypothetical protein
MYYASFGMSRPQIRQGATTQASKFSASAAGTRLDARPVASLGAAPLKHARIVERFKYGASSPSGISTPNGRGVSRGGRPPVPLPAARSSCVRSALETHREPVRWAERHTPLARTGQETPKLMRDEPTKQSSTTPNTGAQRRRYSAVRCSALLCLISEAARSDRRHLSDLS